MHCLRRVAILASAFTALSLGAPQAQELRPAQMTVYVGFGAGGGFDLYSRLLARFIGKHIAGSPTVIVQNMAGAGSVKLANYLYNVAPKDGSAIGMVSQTLPVNQVLGNPGIKFDFPKFGAVGRMATMGTVVIAWHTLPVKSFADARNRTLNVAATGPSSDAYITPALVHNLLGAKFNIITGYAGTAAMMTALERQEADATTVDAASLLSTFSRFIKDKQVTVLVQNSMQRNPAFPDAPTTVELARNDEDRQVLKLFATSGDVGRSLIAPPALSAERLAALRAAFTAAMNDAELKAAAQKSNLDFDPLAGDKLQELVAGIGGLTPALLEKAQAAQKWSK